MENPLLIWATLCLAAAVVIFLLELLIPSGGLLGVLAAVFFIASLIMFYGVSTMVGIIMSIISLAATPFLIAFAIKIWLTTPIARLLTLNNPPGIRDARQPGKAGSEQTQDERDVIGATGVALTDLHPVGSCQVAGRKFDGIAEGAFIQKGTKVRVLGRSGAQLRARPAE